MSYELLNRVKEIDTKHYFDEGVYAKQMTFPKGWRIESHKHIYDHISILSSGRVTVTVDGVENVHIAPSVIKIEANKTHSIYALRDTVWFCIHAVDKEYDIESIDSILIKKDK